MTNQYNSIIITDCRAVQICKVQDKCICKYKKGGHIPAVAGPGSAALSDVQPCP